MPETTEQEDLKTLVTSPGYLRLREWTTSEWQQQFLRHCETAADATDDVAALNRLRQILAAKKAVEFAMDWPVRRLKELQAQTAAAERVPSMTRGGF